MESFETKVIIETIYPINGNRLYNISGIYRFIIQNSRVNTHTIPPMKCLNDVET